MTRLRRLPLGLIGQVFAVLLLAILIEFGVSTYFYERASQLAVRDDEARRLAEHLIIARKLLSEQPATARPALADDLTTTRYEVRWSSRLPPALQSSPTLDRVYRQVVEWEPSLVEHDLRLQLVGSTRSAVIVGGLSLPDRSWMQFSTREPVHELSFSFERILWGLAPAMAIILIGGLLLRRTLLPMRRLAQAAERVGGSDAEEVPEAGPREVRRVIAAFNRMQARIQRLIDDRTQALAAVGHDLRTPLARLRLRVDAIPETDTHDAIEADIAEMQAMIDSLLAYLGGDGNAERQVRIDLAVLCATVADDASDRGGAVEYDGPSHMERVLRPVSIKRALVNLVENALHHGERVWITLQEAGGDAVIRVEDDGPGIPEAALERVLQPFVRLDQSRARDTIGLGLGLSIVVRTVEEEGGTLTLANRAEGGLIAEIRLPQVRNVVPARNISSH